MPRLPQAARDAGDFDRARELLRSPRTLLDDLGVIVLAAATAMHCARIELPGGDLETAETELRGTVFGPACWARW